MDQARLPPGDDDGGEPHVADIRTVGLVGALDLEPIDGTPGKRGYDAMETGFHDHDIMIRITADTIALSPPLIVSEDQIGEITDKVRKILHAIA